MGCVSGGMIRCSGCDILCFGGRLLYYADSAVCRWVAISDWCICFRSDAGAFDPLQQQIEGCDYPKILVD